MSQQLEPTRSQPQAGLTTLSSSVILKEQDQRAATKHIANLLHRLSVLYQIQNWREENSVILAEWILDNYKYEELSMVESVLRNPPLIKNSHGDVDKNWRLTPDTINTWMAPALANAILLREQEQEKFKLAETGREPLIGVDYAAFKKRMEKENPFQESKPTHWSKDIDYLKFRSQRSIKNALTETQNQDGNE